MVKKTAVQRRDFIILYLILVVSISLFFLILLSIKQEGRFYEIDGKINSSMYKLQSSFILLFSNAITNIFNPTMFIILCAFLVFVLIFFSKKREAFFFALILFIGVVTVTLVKGLIKRARPENILVIENSYSYPSSHALMAVIFFGILTFLLYKNLKSVKHKVFSVLVCCFLILIMSVTRIILNAHWFSDILAGLSLGAFLLDLYIILMIKENLLKLKK